MALWPTHRDTDTDNVYYICILTSKLCYTLFIDALYVTLHNVAMTFVFIQYIKKYDL